MPASSQSLVVLAISYGSLIAPNISDELADILSKPVIKIIALVLIFLSRKISSILPIILSLCFIISMQSINKKNTKKTLKQSFNKLEEPNKDTENKVNTENIIYTKDIPPISNKLNILPSTSLEYSDYQSPIDLNTEIKLDERSYSKNADDSNVVRYSQFRKSSEISDIKRYF